MIDTQCYVCIELDDTKGEWCKELPVRTYEGAGKFKCPNCGHILDLSEDTYVIYISREYEDGELYTDFLKMDSEFANAYEPQQELYDILDDLPWGKYRCEVYWHWFSCCDDWDCNTALISTEEVP